MTAFFYYHDLLEITEIRRTRVDDSCTMLSSAPPRSVAYDDTGSQWSHPAVTVNYGEPIYFATHADCMKEWPVKCSQLTPTPLTSTRKQWTFSSRQPIDGTPVIKNGIIYFTSQDHHVYAVTSGGKMLWEFSIDLSIYTSPTIGADDTVYVATFSKVFAIQQDASKPSKKWVFDHTVSSRRFWYSRPVLGDNNTLYIGDSGGSIFALNANNGTQRWTIQSASSSPFSYPVFDPSRNTVYMANWDGTLYAFHSGQAERPKWTFKTDDSIYAVEIAIGTDGTVYVTSTDDKLYALDPANGKKKWSYTTGGPIHSSPSIGPDDVVYFGSSDEHAYAVNGADGTLKWKFKSRGSIYPAVDIRRNLIYVSTSTGKVYAFNSDGSQSWSGTTGKCYAAPAIGENGASVYFPSDDGSLYAFSSPQERAPHVKLKTNSQFYYKSPVSDCANRVYFTEHDVYPSTSYLLAYSFQLVVGGAFTRLWRSLIAGAVFSTPVLGHNGTLYVTSTLKVYAINAATNGEHVWELPLPGTMYGSPAIDDDTLYVGTYAGKFFAIDCFTGKEKWNRTTSGPVHSTPTVGPNGVVYIPVNDGTFNAYWPNGTLRWQMSFTPNLHDPTEYFKFPTTAAVSDDNVIYLGSSNFHLYAISSTGIAMWNYSLKGHPNSPTVDPFDGTIYFGSENSNAYAIHPNGTEKWVFPTGGDCDGVPAVGPDGLVYFSSYDGNVYALNRDGSLHYEYGTGSRLFSNPLVTNDNVILIGGYSRREVIAFQAPAFCTLLGSAGDPIFFRDEPVTLNSFGAITPACGDIWSKTMCDLERHTNRFCQIYAESNNPPYNCVIRKRRAFLEAVSLSFGFSGNLCSFLLLAIAFFLNRTIGRRRLRRTASARYPAGIQLNMPEEPEKFGFAADEEDDEAYTDSYMELPAAAEQAEQIAESELDA